MAIFSGLDADKYDRQYTDGYLIRRIANYFADFKPQLVGVVIGFVLVSVTSAVLPVFVAWGVEVLERDGWSNTLTLIVGALIVAAILQYLSNWIRRALLSRIVANVVANMRKDAFAAALDRDLAFYDTHKSGKLVSRITSDTQEFGEVLLVTTDVLAQMTQVAILLAILLDTLSCC
jgi:ABC-type multidrug transport system fused ATPase/permease subunit